MYKSIFSLFCDKISSHFWTLLLSVRLPYMVAHWAVCPTWANHHIQQPLCWSGKGAPLPYYVFYASPDITWHAPLVCWPMLASEILPIAGSYRPRTSSLDVIRTSHLKSQRRLFLICYLHIVTISVALVRYFALGGGHSLLWPEAILFLSYWEVYSR